MATRTAIILNPRASSALEEAELLRGLEQTGIDAVTHCIPEHTNLPEWIAHVGRDYDVLVAAGGDGTVATVAAAVVKSGKTLGVLPLGKMNHFARDVGIPANVDSALLALAAGQSRLLDVGLVNGFVFINNASIGAYPHMVWERNRTRRMGLPRPLAAGVAVIRTWLELRTVTVHLCVDGTELVRRSPFVVVGNSEYELEGIRFARRPTMTDGRLSLYVTPGSGRLDALTLPVRALLGTLKDHENFETWQATSIAMHFARRRISLALDGEIRTLNSPLHFSVQRHALRAIVPAEPARVP